MSKWVLSSYYLCRMHKKGDTHVYNPSNAGHCSGYWLWFDDIYDDFEKLLWWEILAGSCSAAVPTNGHGCSVLPSLSYCSRATTADHVYPAVFSSFLPSPSYCSRTTTAFHVYPIFFNKRAFLTRVATRKRMGKICWTTDSNNMMGGVIISQRSS